MGPQSASTLLRIPVGLSPFPPCLSPLPNCLEARKIVPSGENYCLHNPEGKERKQNQEFCLN